MQYKTLRRAAYVPTPDASLTAEFRTLAFPEHWRDELLALCNRNRPEAGRPLRSVPLRRMNQVLQTLAPDLIVRPRSENSGTAGGEDFWLCAPTEVPHPLPGTVLDGLLAIWLCDLCPGDPAAVRRTLDLLRVEPPVWHTRDLPLLQCPSSEGGTAVPLSYQYQLATDHLARRIQDLGAYDTGAGLLHFRAVPRGPREQGAELMSQPLPHEAGSRTWWFSVVINISLHTVPFSPFPRLHLHTGIRRWNTHTHRKDGRLALPFGRATSVYLLPRVPWLPGAPVSRRHAVAKLAWNRDVRGIDWSAGGPAGMLRRLTLTERFPDAESILTDPLHWFTQEKGTRAAVVHSNHMGPHKVGHGLMSHQRSQITEWAEQALPDGLVAAPPLSISKRGPRGPLNPRPKPSAAEKQDVEQRTADVRREALATALPTGTGPVPFLEARLLWQTRELREETVAALKAVLGLKGDGDAGGVTQQAYEEATPGRPVLLTWDSPELTVRLRCLPLAGGLADDLPIDPAVRPKQRALGEALRSRRAVVAQWLRADGATSEDPSLALVEIDRREDFTTAAHDAKFALRLGCADAGILTQFTHVAKLTDGDDTPGSLSHRTRSAWNDGLRQLGVRVVPEHALGDSLPAGLQYVAVWMVKKRKDGRTGLPRYLPVAVKVTPGKAGNGSCVVTGWDRELRRWVPYPRFLLALTRHAEIPQNLDVPAPRPGEDTEAPAVGSAPPWEWKQNVDEQRADTARWLGHVRRSLRGTDSVLLAHAQNCRSLWPWLGNGRVTADLVQFSDEPAGRLDAGLRIVRVRGAQGRETPQWWGINTPGKPNGLSMGLWCEPSNDSSSERIFYSTTEKPSQFAATAVSADKLKARPLLKGKNKGELTTDSRVAAWNPAMVEIAVLGCRTAAEGEAEALALAVHHLRQAPDYGASLSNPLPLHLASKAQEYVLPTVGQDDEPEGSQDAAVEDPTSAVSAHNECRSERFLRTFKG